MTNEELQVQVLSDLKKRKLSAWAFLSDKQHDSPYPINRRAVWQIARGKFDSKEVGKYGLLKMKDYFNTKNEHDE